MCRTRETKTPFLNTALTGNDRFLGRPLTDSELAEESMGGMFGGSGTTANTFVYLLWATLRQPELAKRLREELQVAFPGGKYEVPEAAVSTYTTSSGRVNCVDANMRPDMCEATSPASRYQRNPSIISNYHCHPPSKGSERYVCRWYAHTSWRKFKV